MITAKLFYALSVAARQLSLRARLKALSVAARHLSLRARLLIRKLLIVNYKGIRNEDDYCLLLVVGGCDGSVGGMQCV